MLQDGQENVRRRRVSVRDYTLIQLAGIYSVSRYIMLRKLLPYRAEVGQPTGYYYDPRQVGLIFKLIPLPSHVEVVKT